MNEQTIKYQCRRHSHDSSVRTSPEETFFPDHGVERPEDKYFPLLSIVYSRYISRCWGTADAASSSRCGIYDIKNELHSTVNVADRNIFKYRKTI